MIILHGHKIKATNDVVAIAVVYVDRSVQELLLVVPCTCTSMENIL